MTELANQELNPILKGLRTVAADAEREFGALSGTQLNWKPAADSWSVAQVFEHLITTNTLFFPQLEKIIAGTHRNSAWQSISPFTGFIGRYLIRSLDPRSVKRVPAPKAALPSRSELDPGIVQQFVEHQSRVEELVAATDGIDLKRTIVTSPFLKLATYSLSDGYQIVVVHEQRHLGQARRVTQMPGFPAAG